MDHMRKSPQSSQNRTRCWIAFAIVCVAVFGLYGFSVHQQEPLWPLNMFWTNAQEQQVVIKEGEGAFAIAEQLFDAHIISSRQAFLATVEEQGAGGRMQAGTYILSGAMSATELVDQLMTGPNSEAGRLQIPEGLALDQTADLVQANLNISKEEFLNQAKASNYQHAYPFLRDAADDSLEGFLAGATYSFDPENVDTNQVISAMLNKYQSLTQSLNFETAAEIINQQYNLHLSAYDLLKVASIAQKEGANQDDYAQVAGVFYNRLRDGWKLESDATMSYSLGHSASAEELKQEDPYNTYLIDGLPPTPICSPSIEAIEGALNPSASNNYYFVIYEQDGISVHAFSENYNQHQAAINELSAKMREAGI